MRIDWEQAGGWSQLATRIPPELHQKLKLRAILEDSSMMRLVVEGILLRLREKAE